MIFCPDILEEPLLEFGGNGREIDIRLGLIRHGPLEPERTAKVRLGIIGTAETTEGFARFLDRCKVGLDAKKSRQPNLFLPFPGFGITTGQKTHQTQRCKNQPGHHVDALVPCCRWKNEKEGVLQPGIKNSPFDQRVCADQLPADTVSLTGL